MVLVALVVGASWVVLHLFPVVLVVIGALFLAVTLAPTAEWLEKRRVSRKFAVPIVFLTTLILCVLVAVLTVPSLMEQVSTLVKNEPAVRGRLADWLSHSRLTWPLADSLRRLHYDALARVSAETAFDYSTRAITIVAYSISAIFLALYITIDRDRLRAGLFSTVSRKHHIRLSRVILGLETIVGGYIRGQVLTSLFMTGFTFVLLLSCGAPNALALAVFAGVADVLPYVGVFLSVAPVVADVIPKGPTIALVITAAMLAYEEFESRVLVPRIYGRALRLPSSIVLVALLIGGTLLGFVGALLALPVAAAIRMIIEELRFPLPGAPNDDPAVRARDDMAEREYELRAEGMPVVVAAQIAVRIAEEQDRFPHGARSDTLPPA